MIKPRKSPLPPSTRASKENSTLVLNQGDIITFAGVHQINPMNRQSTGDLRQFVVLANVTSNGSGQANIPIACVDGDGITLAGPQIQAMQALVQQADYDMKAIIGIYGPQPINGGAM